MLITGVVLFVTVVIRREEVVALEAPHRCPLKKVALPIVQVKQSLLLMLSGATA